MFFGVIPSLWSLFFKPGHQIETIFEHGGASGGSSYLQTLRYGFDEGLELMGLARLLEFLPILNALTTKLQNKLCGPIKC